MKKLTCLFVLSLCFLKAAAPISRTFTVEQFQYLLSNALSLSNDGLNGKARSAKALGIKPFLNSALLSEANPIKKRYAIVRNLLACAPTGADFSCLEKTPHLEATIALMAHLSANKLRPRLNQVLATRFPEGPVGNPSGMFMASGTCTLEGLKHCFDFYEWYRDDDTYHTLFQIDEYLATRTGRVLLNAAAYLALLGEKENRLGHYAQQSLPILLQAQAMAPDFLHVYYQLHGLYTRLSLKAEADRWYAEGDSRCQRIQRKELREYVEGFNGTTRLDLKKTDLNTENPEEILISLRHMLQRPDLTALKRFMFLGFLIKKSSDPSEKIHVLELAIKLLTEPLLIELFQNKKTSTLSSMLSIEEKTCSAYRELKRRVTQALIGLEDLELAMVWAEYLKLPEALDTVSGRYRQSKGIDETSKVVLCDLKALEEGSEAELRRLLQSLKNPANALSLEALEEKGLGILRERLRDLEEAGLKTGDTAYDNTVREIQAKEAESTRRRKASFIAETQESNRFWASAVAAGDRTCGGKAHPHRSGSATCAAAAASSAAVEVLSSSDDEGSINPSELRNEAERSARESLSYVDQATFDALKIDFHEAEGCRIKVTLSDGAKELYSFTFHGQHGESAANLSAERKAWYKRLCFERYKQYKPYKHYKD